MTTLLRSTDDAGIATITINRPDKLNALNADVMADLDHAFAQIEEDDDVRGVILTGSGDKSFVAGADISQFPEFDAARGEAFARQGQAVFSRIEASGKPVVAAVNGFALGGGCELAMACHLRVASEKAKFGQPEVNLGVIAGYGGTQRLPRLVGRGRALELLLTGEIITAQRAYEMGLVNRVAPHEDLLAVARDLMQTILGKAPQALRLTLEAVYASDQPLEDGLATEADLFGQACATEDAKEGARAFLDRRPPKFTNA